MTESTPQHRPAPASPDPATPPEDVAAPSRPIGWRRAASSVLDAAMGGSAAGVPF